MNKQPNRFSYYAFLCLNLALALTFTTPNIYSTLSPDESSEALQRLQLKNHLPLLHQQLTAMFEHSELSWLKEVPKVDLVSQMARQELSPTSRQRVSSNLTSQASQTKDYLNLHIPTLKQHGVDSIVEPGSGHTLVFKLPTNNPALLLKVCICNFIDNKKMQPSAYQNISRVFYADTINEVVAQKNLQYIRPIQEYLFKIPGRPESSPVTDENYWVVTEYLANTPSHEENARTMTELSRIFNVEEFKKIVWELCQVICLAGLWDLKAHNLFYLNEQKLFTFIDTEKPGLGGGPDGAFYRKDPELIQSNATVGLQELEKTMNIKLEKLFGLTYKEIYQIATKE